MPTFCRHNRFIERCPICSKNLPADSPLRPRAAGGGSRQAAKRSAAGRPSRAPVAGAGGPASRRSPRGESLRVRRETRAEDDGYRSPLVPGLHARADAERLADEIAFSHGRLIALAVAPVGRYAEAKAIAASDIEQATWMCFEIAVTPSDADHSGDEAPGELAGASGAGGASERGGETREAYRNWVKRSGGSQAEAFRGDPSWTPERRFERLFERLALPAFPRRPRYELLVTLGRLGLYELRAGSLQLVGAGTGEDETTLAAKRIFAIGDPLLLERRAAALAGAIDVPIEALDLALANWAAPRRITLGFPADVLDEGALARAKDALSL